jgi:hypothetical protein
VAAVAVVAALAVLAAGCKPRRPPATPAGMTLAAGPPPGLLATLVWVGRGEAERFEGGAWRRIPAFDYELSVEQRRYADHWDSIKTMRRRHPDYDGSAGPRLQVMAFRIELFPGERPGTARYELVSSLGKGTGHGDAELRESVLDIKADVSFFAPFDRYRITQHYQYEAGRLDELVELNDGDSPWVRNHEEATLFGAQRFAEPPTKLASP